MEKLAQKILGYIENKILSLSEEQKEYIYFGLQLILESFVEAITIILISVSLRIFVETFVILMVSGIFKLISGGAHCNTFSSCYVFSIIAYPLAGMITKYLIGLNFITLPYMYFIFFISTVVCFFYAPAQVAVKPIDDSARLYYKVASLLFILSLFVAVVTLYLNDFRELSIIISFAVTFQVFFITPLGFFVTEAFDKLFYKVTHRHRKGVKL